MALIKFTKPLMGSLLLTSLFISVSCSASKPTPDQTVTVKQGGVIYTSNSINEQLAKEAVRGSKFEVEQRGDAVVIIMPVKDSFNAKRPDVLLPVTLTPLTKIAKLVKQDRGSVIVIVGHTDNVGNESANNELSLSRAKSIGSVFGVAGLSHAQLFATGVGSNQPRATNNTAKGREQNKRVELFIVKKQGRELVSLPSFYATTHYTKKK